MGGGAEGVGQGERLPPDQHADRRARMFYATVQPSPSLSHIVMLRVPALTLA